MLNLEKLLGRDDIDLIAVEDDEAVRDVRARLAAVNLARLETEERRLRGRLNDQVPGSPSDEEIREAQQRLRQRSGTNTVNGLFLPEADAAREAQRTLDTELARCRDDARARLDQARDAGLTPRQAAIRAAIPELIQAVDAWLSLYQASTVKGGSREHGVTSEHLCLLRATLKTVQELIAKS